MSHALVPTSHLRRRRLAELAVAVVLAAFLLLGSLVPAAVPTARAVEGVVATGATTLIVQPAKRRVHADVKLRIRNDRPRTTVGGVSTDWVVQRWAIAVPDQATHVKVTRDGARLSTTIRERDGFDQVAFDLRPDLPFGKTATVRISYDLPDGGARSASPIRVGRAYISFYAFAHGDDRATLTIDVPEGFEVSTRGGEITTRTDGDGRTILTTAGPVDDNHWYVIVEGTRPAALHDETLQVQIDGRPRYLDVRSWPEDDLWATRVRDRLTTGLVALHELNGLDWPVVGPLQVTESATRSLNGYAGFYDPGGQGVLDKITISEEPDDQVIVHEAAHAWFNDGLLAGRWISEGFAEAYAARALTRLGSTPPPADPAFRDASVTFPLNLWAPPGRIDDATAQAHEVYGYDASRQVIDTLIDEIGEDGMRMVLAAADDEAIAYPGVPKRETQTLVATFKDWRYFLDLLEQVGGSAQAPELFKTWVVSDNERPLLVVHERLVAQFDRLVERADGWLPAYAIRAQMARWAFVGALPELDLAETALDRRAEIEPQEAALGLDDGGALKSAFEGAQVSYDDVVSLADEELETLAAVNGARAIVTAEREPLVAIGLVGTDTSVDLAAAAAAYRAGHLGESRDDAAAAAALINGAEAVGTQRATAAGAALAIAVVGLGIVILVVRRRRSRVTTPAAVGAPATLAARTEPMASDVASEAGTAEGEEGT
ncbi:MAG: hypothetical protein ACHQ02_05555 [Candidatus Limnocylindrales bacterium]